MDKKNLIELTKKLYRLTLFFPKKEPLRYKARDLADEILANFLRIKNISNPTTKTEDSPLRLLEEDLEVLNSFFEVAQVQNWVSPNVLFEIQQEYSKIEEAIGKIHRLQKGDTEIENPEMALEATAEDLTPQYSLFQDGKRVNERQGRILEILKEREKAQVWELKKVFPEVTKRTLRRDFEQMFKRGLIERIGEKNDTYYQLKPAISEER